MTHERCAFPGESCEARATKLAVGRASGVRIPLCAHHAERVQAHKTSLDLWPQVAVVSPLDERVVRTRANLRAHVNRCATCQPIDVEATRRMAAGEVRTPAEVMDLGLLIDGGACATGRGLWEANGAAMLGLDASQESS